MPLVHQDTLRGGGGPNENRRPVSDFFATFDALQSPEPGQAPAVNHRIKDCTGEGWVWDEPRSPEAAQTPRALVPDACFPPKHPMAFASYSESAQPGGVTWTDDSKGQGLTGLVASLKALGMPAPSTRITNTNGNSEGLDKNIMESQWLIKSQSRDERRLSRRASFCGALSPTVPSVCMSEGGAARWSGALPARCADPANGYSSKVFLGGLPWDITEQALTHAFRHFHPLRVEWPGRDATASGSMSPRGFAYMTLESERRVRALLAASRQEGNAWYYRVASKKHHAKDVEVIPWCVSDSNWVVGGSVRLEPGRTVFVGALHGMITAEALANIMNDLFSGVVYAGIDTDKNKYPIGSGRVTFNNVRSYVRAISAGHVEIYTDKFTKKVQVDPYLEDSMCSVCNLHQGPYFCREPMCFRYFCRGCWAWQHPAGSHRALCRSARPHPDTPHHHNGGFAPPTDRTPSPTINGASAANVTSGSGGSETDPVHDWTQMSAAV